MADGDVHARELPLPPGEGTIEGLLADAELAAHPFHRRAALGLPQSKRDLLIREPALFDRPGLQTEAE